MNEILRYIDIRHQNRFGNTTSNSVGADYGQRYIPTSRLCLLGMLRDSRYVHRAIILKLLLRQHWIHLASYRQAYWWMSFLNFLKFLVLKMAGNFFRGYFIPNNGSYTAWS